MTKADPKLMAKIREALTNSFPDANLNVGPGYFDNIHIIVTSRKFEGKSNVERQEIVWSAVDSIGLDDAEKAHISMILPQTPEEFAA